MATETSSIDDLLMAQSMQSPTQPAAPEIEYAEEVETPDIVAKTPEDATIVAEQALPTEIAIDEYGNEEQKPVVEQDEYGNERPVSKTYTEDEVNERINMAIRERLARLERNNGQQYSPQQVQQQVQQAQQGFEYNADSTETWQQQLENFVDRRVEFREQRQIQQQQQMREQQLANEHAQRMRQGASKFSDFESVVPVHTITDAMTLATRSMKDPAAFIYAASKRAPQDLQRIAALSDPYAQMVEMGKLEERMKQTKQTTSKAPKPISRTQEDSTITHKSDKQPTIEEMIAKADAKKIAKFNARRGR